MKKSFPRKGRTSSLSRTSWESVQSASGKGKDYEVGKKVQNLQRYDCFQNQRFQTYTEAPWANELLCHFKLLKKLFEGHQTSMSKKCKRV